MDQDIMSTKKSKPHAIMFPLPYQGHVTPSIHLAMKLASIGFTITFINTKSIHNQIINSQSDGGGGREEEEDIFSRARQSEGLDIRYKTVTDGLPLELNRYTHQGELAERHFLGFPAHVDELVGELVESDPSISCLIADTFYSWPPKIAHKYRLVNISFWTQSALVFSILYYHFDHLLCDNGHVGSKDMPPGVKAIKSKDLPSFIQGSDAKAYQSFFLETFMQFKKADFILCNTVLELESEVISFLQDKQPIYAVGPIVPPSGPAGSTVPRSLRTTVDCVQWLNTKPKGSVLFVSFGSFLPCRECDIEEIAHGIVLSGVNFIWVIRHDAVSYDQNYSLPSRFSDDINNGKGLIIPWCDQIEVISHPSIGGFLTHCGWNSVLESLCYNDAPFLCNPLVSDQLTNRKLVVDDWRVGVNLCDGASLTRSEIAEKIDRLMSGKLVDELRGDNIVKVRQIVRNALDLGGSSEKNLRRFYHDVMVKITTMSMLYIPPSSIEPADAMIL